MKTCRKCGKQLSPLEAGTNHCSFCYFSFVFIDGKYLSWKELRDLDNPRTEIQSGYLRTAPSNTPVHAFIPTKAELDSFVTQWQSVPDGKVIVYFRQWYKFANLA